MISAAHSRTPSRGGRPSPAGSEQISARILKAAQTLFLRDGFADTSMDAIAAEIGISKRTLYSRHSGKAALFEAVAIDIVKAGVSKIVFDDLPERTLRERLLALSLSILSVATDPAIIALERVITGELRHFPQLADLIYHFGQSPLVEEISILLREYEASKADPALDAEIFLAVAIAPHLRRAVLQRAKPGLEGVDRALLERTIDIFVQGIQGTRRGMTAEPIDRATRSSSTTC